ncbi:diguanylate cyclase domain-containing protein, partial [Selenomonas montiformis]|uniref:diguanylate cyclase domain-containing protein n=1 Tax=Selenomonas montiformis TaxID=2652285 RepID=UPI0039F48A96
ENLRYLYTMFEDVYLVHIRQDRMERLYAHTSFSQPSLQGPVHGISQTVRRVAQNYVYEDDRERYLAFFDADTIVGRIRKSTSGRISCRFRMRDRHGNYNWRECAVVLLSNGNDPAVMVAARMADQPAALPETPHTAGSGLSELLWRNFCRNTPFCYFWKDRQRRFLGATKAFLKHYGFESEQVILGKTDEDLNWHVDNDLYRLDEIDVLRTGRVVENVSGECIVKGVLHHITCYKWPLYQGGQIIGLLGVFFDADDMYRSFGKDRPSPYEDSVTKLRNRQGFLGALLSYHEAYTVQHQPFCLILFESRSDDLLKESYEPMILRSLVCEEARCLREIAGKDSVIARIKEFDFAILRRETQPQESERMARRIQEKLQGIHRIGGTPVTITFRYSIVHADEPDVRKAVRRNAANLYRLAMRRLRSGGSEEAGK